MRGINTSVICFWNWFPREAVRTTRSSLTCEEILVRPHCACHQRRNSLFFIDCHTAGCRKMLCLMFKNNVDSKLLGYQVLIEKAQHHQCVPKFSEVTEVDCLSDTWGCYDDDFFIFYEWQEIHNSMKSQNQQSATK